MLLTYVFLLEPWTEDGSSTPQSATLQSDPSLKDLSQILRKLPLPPPKAPTSPLNYDPKSICECCSSKTPEIPGNGFPPIMDKLLVAVFVLVLLFGVAYSSCNAGDGPGDEPKKRSLYSNKRGNKHTREQKRKRRREENALEAQPNVQLSSLNILQNQQKACQAKGCDKYLLNFFRKTDSTGEFCIDEAVDDFNKFRKETLGLSKKKLNEECLSLFIRLHDQQFAKGVGDEKWHPDSQRLILTIRDAVTPVCTQAFVEAHGFTMSRWKRMARVARDMSNKGKVGTSRMWPKAAKRIKNTKKKRSLTLRLPRQSWYLKSMFLTSLKRCLECLSLQNRKRISSASLGYLSIV